MISVQCDRCQGDLDEPGAVLIGPPLPYGGYVEKRHLCVRCYWDVLDWCRNAISA